MKNFFIKHKTSNIKLSKAFTLVELSVVLVIIGLLAGGIVGGNALIQTAKNQKVVEELRKFQTSYTAFDVKYNAYPGDIANASEYFSSTVSGDGNGRYNYSTEVFSSASIEGKVAFDHLQKAGMSGFRYTGNSTSKNRDSLPTIDINGLTAAYKNVYIFGNVNSVGYPMTGFNFLAIQCDNQQPYLDHGCLPVKVASFIDKKMDDNKPFIGSVISANSSWAATGCVNAAINSGSTTATYTLSGNNDCNLYYLLK